MIGHMKKALPNLNAVKNLSEFSRHSGIPLRTLQRYKAAADGDSFGRTTIAAIAMALTTYKPKKKAPAP